MKTFSHRSSIGQRARHLAECLAILSSLRSSSPDGYEATRLREVVGRHCLHIGRLLAGGLRRPKWNSQTSRWRTPSHVGSLIVWLALSPGDEERLTEDLRLVFPQAASPELAAIAASLLAEATVRRRHGMIAFTPIGRHLSAIGELQAETDDFSQSPEIAEEVGRHLDVIGAIIARGLGRVRLDRRTNTKFHEYRCNGFCLTLYLDDRDQVMAAIAQALPTLQFDDIRAISVAFWVELQVLVHPA
jgi:hypothetical protein